MSKTPLITGITGQDGSYLAELLLTKNYKVYGMVRRSSSSSLSRVSHFSDRIDIVPGDLLDQFSMIDAIEQTQPHEIYNLASQSYVPLFGPLATPQTVTPLAYDDRHYRWLDLPRQPYFLYLGRHAPYKNLARLIQAFAQLPAGATDLELWIGGGDDRRFTPALQAQGLHLGLQGGYGSWAMFPRWICPD